MRRKITALMVMVTLLLSIITTGAMAKNDSSNVKVTNKKDGSVQVTMNFRDLQEAKWAIKNILKMNQEDIIMGYDDGSFRPNKPVTQAEAIVLTMRAAGLQSEIDSQVVNAVYLPFKDAKKIPGWASKAVALAVAKGYIQAGPSGNFQPNKAANREWVVKLIAKTLNLQPVDIQLPFTDAAKISSDTAGYIAAVVYKQLISGFPDGSFQPNKPVTRAEIAVMLGISTNEEPIPGDFKFKVEGTINAVSLQSNDVSGQIYSGVTDIIYGSTQGSITLNVNKDDDEDEDEDEDENEGAPVTVTYPVSTNALIYVNDQAAKLSDLTVGAKAEAIVKNGMITYVEVEPVVVKGVVQAVYNNTVTVLNINRERGKKYDLAEPTAATYNLADNVTVTLNGLTAKASDLKASDVVRMTLNAEQKITSIKAARFVLKMKKEKANGIGSEKAKDKVEEAKDKAEKAKDKVEKAKDKVEKAKDKVKGNAQHR